MKLRRNTWLLILLAAILGGWVYFYEIRGKEQRSELATQQQEIFNFTEGAIKKITIAQPEQILEFIKTANSLQPWQMKQPKDVTASDATVSFLVDLLVNGKSDRAFTVPTSQLSQYGLDQPLATITVELETGESHTIILGKSNFDERSLYAQIDSLSTNSSETKIVLRLSRHLGVNCI
jgi:hypothetical protein